MKLKFTKPTLFVAVLIGALFLYNCTGSDMKKTQEINANNYDNRIFSVADKETAKNETEVAKGENEEKLPVYIRVNNDDTKPVTDIYPFVDGNGLYGIIDSNGAVVVLDETVGYINTFGELVIDLSETGASAGPPEHGFLPYYCADSDYEGYDFSEGLAYVTIPRTEYEEDYTGYFWWDHDETGKRIIDPEHYTDIPKGYYIDKAGNKVLEGVIGTEFVCGLAAARDPETGKVGYIDKTGKFVIEPQFELAYPFRESGFAMVSYGENGHYLPDLLMGCVNTNGEIIIPVEYAGFHLPPFDISSGEIIEFLKENSDGSATLCYFDSKGTLLGMIDSTYYKPKT